MADKRQLSNAEIISNDTFERLKSRNNRRRILRVLTYVLAGLFFCTVFVVICVVLFFKVQIIEVTGTQIYGYDNDKIRQTSGIEVEQNLYTIGSGQVKDAIINAYPYIKDVKVKRYLPDTIEIELVEDTPRYYMVIGGEYFIMSEDLRVLEKVDDSERIDRINISYNLIKLEMPVVTYAVVGKEIMFRRESNFEYVKNLLDLIQMTDIYDDISEFNIVNKFNIYFIYNNYKIIIGNNDNISSKIILAKEIFDRITDEFAIIDVADITKGSVRPVLSIDNY